MFWRVPVDMPHLNSRTNPNLNSKSKLESTEDLYIALVYYMILLWVFYLDAGHTGPRRLNIVRVFFVCLFCFASIHAEYPLYLDEMILLDPF